MQTGGAGVVTVHGAAFRTSTASSLRDGKVKGTGSDGKEKNVGIGQVVHVAVFSPKGKELEWYRDNLLFEGTDFEAELPISFSEEPGEYSVKVEYPITGMKSEATFEVRP
jgi:hypothetical protein